MAVVDDSPAGHCRCNDAPDVASGLILLPDGSSHISSRPCRPHIAHQPAVFNYFIVNLQSYDERVNKKLIPFLRVSSRRPSALDSTGCPEHRAEALGDSVAYDPICVVGPPGCLTVWSCRQIATAGRSLGGRSTFSSAGAAHVGRPFLPRKLRYRRLCRGVHSIGGYNGLHDYS